MENLIKSIPDDEVLKAQTVEVDEQSRARCSVLLKDRKLLEYLDEDARTVHEIFLRGLKVSKNGPCLGWRPDKDSPYSWISYQETLDRSQHFGSGLIALGAEPNTDQVIGIFSQNRVEWKLAEQACNCYSMVTVPLYDTLGLEALRHIVTQCDLKFIVVDSTLKVKTLLEECDSGKITLDTIILMDYKEQEEILKLAEKNSVKVKSFSEVEKEGRDQIKDFVPPKPEDLHTICYTSGTTGTPKGAMLTHGNCAAEHAGICALAHKSMNLGVHTVYLSYLPLAHVFERLMAITVYYAGGRIGFFQGDIKLLGSDMAALQPTTMGMVPRLINRLYDRIWTQASQSFIKRNLLNFAAARKMTKIKKGIVTRETIWDKIVFGKICNLLGGKLSFCITGAAPVSIDVLNFMRSALGIPFLEGYGQTESCAGITITHEGDYVTGSVGAPALCNFVKLVDVPEKNYFAKDGKGEVCAKGNNIFIGYYKNEEKTKEALDEDGWLHTGDIGMWLPNGALKIIDRKKHIFKLAQGEYIAPEKIESVLCQSIAVAQVFIYGESLKSSLVGIVVPDQDFFEKWCASHGVCKSFNDLIDDGNVNKLVMEDLTAIGKEKDLKGFELPKKIFLSKELFTVENDMLTPTFKTRRLQVYNRYKTEIQQMYEALD